MCEIFGNYGWSEGVRLEKYLADHFMVQGVNQYVPHAFSAKAYPDPDCPPHFYAHGHNPQYRHFGALMAYMNRICALISGGKAVVETGILYHGDAEWAGEAMMTQKPARILMENQVDFHVLPTDVFEERERYQTSITPDGLMINGNCYRRLLIPKAEYISAELAKAIREMKNGGCEVFFIDQAPKGIADTQEKFDAAEINICMLQDILKHVNRKMEISPASWRIRALHYQGKEEIYYFVNEDNQPYLGTVTIPFTKELYQYNAWENRAEEAEYVTKQDKTEVKISLKPGESVIYVVGKCAALQEKALPAGHCHKLDGEWKRSICKSIDYPKFQEEKIITSFKDYGKEKKRFSGFIAYEKEILKSSLGEAKKVVLEITDAGEAVEVFVNGKSAGIQILPPFYYDITDTLTEEKNVLRIEAATNLERERNADKKNWKPIGITGNVNLYLR